MRPLHYRTAIDRPETTTSKKVPPISEVVWQQPPNKSVNQHKFVNIHNDFAIKTTQKTQRLENTQLSDIKSQISPPEGTEPQRCLTATEHFRENQAENGR